MLASISLQPGHPTDIYPFDVPAIQSLTTLNFSRSRITFFTGENGSGKSTLLEAIALNYGLSLDGGNRNFVFEADLPKDDTYPLARALKLSFRPIRSGEGFFFRAETLFNLATRIDDLGLTRGEAFLTVLDHKFRRSGLFLLDEPEAALSPQRQLSFLILIHDTLRDYPDAQFSSSPRTRLSCLRYPTPKSSVLTMGRLARSSTATLRPSRSHAAFSPTTSRLSTNCYAPKQPSSIPPNDSVNFLRLNLTLESPYPYSHPIDRPSRALRTSCNTRRSATPVCSFPPSASAP
jgi:predicted ATPase